MKATQGLTGQRLGLAVLGGDYLCILKGLCERRAKGTDIALAGCLVMADILQREALSLKEEMSLIGAGWVGRLSPCRHKDRSLMCELTLFSTLKM